ncbi:L(+)-tartrate dehydratase subunit alpha [Corynebacterium aurimucosum]|uniref:L(+)-tartrate dehydratase subunit alpha n=1 Tax=Corynebacterium aurimucosum (strain ATCC 700975 / DSM 44827 / CIP 107346 / CN-1) TaxID=548476 RepID=C3PJK7_CORA7|nr:L(+)-tartrate dehydratase subunit alpha [Corynebacterium aurimucosum]ACP33893.1 tartrate dehydratase [Corynebacterium aurimucosum ATCC 700975]QQU92017.1 L(+)-tartrate dehydratase subunit alpha [Corynebacterium aurimucosum]QQU96306.1 L(+)-tartrate dehydratase subunit alpha [Corynebacterium aurimucosum]UTA70809.1 L(+)-tartrate dehydratase subunit alpha [Corynebacterium aurimucosum]WJY71424.1 L(+)-tartrate dehydratase subunit alpha [Corynebacterium aurimucosum]
MTTTESEVLRGVPQRATRRAETPSTSTVPVEIEFAPSTKKPSELGHQFSPEVQLLIDRVAKFTDLVSKRLPDDVTERLRQLAEEEDQPMAKMIYKTMQRNQKLALDLDRPSCQDTGQIQIFARVGTEFPYLSELEPAMKEAIGIASETAPLRRNSVETFNEYNPGTNIGTKSPWLYTELISGSDELELDVYLAGGGCSLPGQGKTLMPGEGYEAAMKFILDVMTSYGVNACPPMLIGVGIGTSIDTAGFMSKLALMRPVQSHNQNEVVAELEKNLETAINDLGLGPQGLGGKRSVMGVNIENSARHPSVLSVAVNTGCWSHRRGTIHLDRDLNYRLLTHSGFEL